MLSLRLAFVALLAAAAGVNSQAAARDPPAILVFSKTLAFRHDSIPTAIAALRTMSTETSPFTPTFTEDSALFRSSTLSRYALIVFLSNSEGLLESDPEVLDEEGKAAFVEWLGKGGALVGLHAGTACLFRMPEFGVAMGSWFDYHPTISNVTFNKVTSHPTVDMLPDDYTIFEEAYNFLTDPRSVNATVLLTPDPTSYADPEFPSKGHYQGSPHPSAWYREEGVDLNNGTTDQGAGRMEGRLWMTSLGHTNETWEDELFLSHVQEGIRWALGGEKNTLLNDSSTTNSSSSTPSSTARGSTSATASSASATGPSAAPSSTAAAPASDASSLRMGGVLSLLGLGLGLLM